MVAAVAGGDPSTRRQQVLINDVRAREEGRKGRAGLQIAIKPGRGCQTEPNHPPPPFDTQLFSSRRPVRQP